MTTMNQPRPIMPCMPYHPERWVLLRSPDGVHLMSWEWVHLPDGWRITTPVVSHEVDQKSQLTVTTRTGSRYLLKDAAYNSEQDALHVATREDALIERACEVWEHEIVRIDVDLDEAKRILMTTGASIP